MGTEAEAREYERTRTAKEGYVVNEKGKRIGILIDLNEYHKMLEELEDLESIRAYDEAKTSGSEAIPFETAVEEIERERE